MSVEHTAAGLQIVIPAASGAASRNPRRDQASGQGILSFYGAVSTLPAAPKNDGIFVGILVIHTDPSH